MGVDLGKVCRECGWEDEHQSYCPRRPRRLFYVATDYRGCEIYIEGDEEVAEEFRKFLQEIKE